jgi:hypothetical protein
LKAVTFDTAEEGDVRSEQYVVLTQPLLTDTILDQYPGGTSLIPRLCEAELYFPLSEVEMRSKKNTTSSLATRGKEENVSEV